MFCFHILATRFIVPPFYFPFDSLRDSAFDKFRDELIEVGRLKQVPLRALNYAAICGGVELCFKGPIGVDAELSDPWISSCDHEKQEIEGLQQEKGWITEEFLWITRTLQVT
ncbi:hypothetical protein Agabi119p4_5252 [Agaricus bisporus var. burnettii]|uniref:Uncharacterized protein n=1 Tax=Agaricus bisporus var. burnettii TaxID=192524 RepID=A0A8H7F558_AGABI|nr:hypothetical protein Agabi119p4_5252 [Agaricus bisporus var. burnettii]